MIYQLRKEAVQIMTKYGLFNELDWHIWKNLKGNKL